MDIPSTINHKHHQIHITKIVKPPTSISNNINNSTVDSTNNAINSNGTYSNRKVFYSINKNELNFPSSSAASSSAAVSSSSATINYNVNNKILSTVLPINSSNNDHHVANGNYNHNDHAQHRNANNENKKEIKSYLALILIVMMAMINIKISIIKIMITAIHQT